MKYAGGGFIGHRLDILPGSINVRQAAQRSR